MSKRIQLADCCNGDCRQGRDCPRPPLFPMQPGGEVEQDEPPYSCDSVMELLPSWVAWLFVACTAACMAIACGWLDPLFPR